MLPESEAEAPDPDSDVKYVLTDALGAYALGLPVSTAGSRLALPPLAFVGAAATLFVVAAFAAGAVSTKSSSNSTHTRINLRINTNIGEFCISTM